MGFPFLFGRAFIEAHRAPVGKFANPKFPFLFGRAFIEARSKNSWLNTTWDISLPFRKGFH